jgi:tripeptide aminopeptidase
MIKFKYPLNHHLLFQILEIQSESRDCIDMQAFLWEYAESRQWEVDCDDVGNIYITKGMAVHFPCVVAHMDTVHSIQPMGDANQIVPVIVHGNKITGINPSNMRQTGIGGDDKCGIYAALEALNHLEACKVAFFVDEEIGCVGSYQCNLDFFSDVRFILQADRRGKSDFVNNIWGPISSEKFCDDVLPYLAKYNFHLEDGMMTDVQALRDRNVGVSCANISAGYYNPHQDHEYIDIHDLTNTTNLMLQLCEELQEVYPFTAPKRDRWGSSSAYGTHNYIPSWSKKSYSQEDQFIDEMRLKYGFPEDDGSPPFDVKDIDVMELSHKHISEMTDAEWIAYNNDILEKELDNAAFPDDNEEYEKWWEAQQGGPVNCYV